LHLSVIITLQDNCDEQLQEDKCNYKVVARKKEVGEGSIRAAHGLLTCINVVLVCWVKYALLQDARLHHE